MTAPATNSSPFLGSVHAGADLGRRGLREGAFAFTGQVFTLVATILSTMILARLATPADFGIVAMALTLVSFIGVFNDFGVPAAVVHRDDLTHQQASTLFWVGVGLSTLVALLSLAFSPVLAWFFDEPRLIKIFPLMALVFVGVGLGTFHLALLKRQLRFGVIASIQFTALCIGWGTAIFLASRGAGYWAIAAQYPTTATARVILLWTVCRWRPGRPSRLIHVSSILSFSKDVTLYRIVTHLGKHLDRILIGHLAGPAALGFYSAADRWAMFPILQLYPRLTTVAVSGLSRVRNDQPRYRDYQRRSFELLLTVLLPILAITFVEAHNIVLVLMGAQWVAVVPLLQILLVGAYASSLSQFTKWIYLVEGRTRRQLRWGLFSSIIVATAVAIGSYWGATGVAIAFSAITCVLAIPGIAICLSGSPIQWIDVFRSAWRSLAASILSALVLLLAKPFFPMSALMGLVTSATAFGCVYLLIWIALPGGGQAFARMLRVIKALR